MGKILVVAARRGVLQSCMNKGLGRIGAEIATMNNQGLAADIVSRSPAPLPRLKVSA